MHHACFWFNCVLSTHSCVLYRFVCSYLYFFGVSCLFVACCYEWYLQIRVFFTDLCGIIYLICVYLLCVIIRVSCVIMNGIHRFVCLEFVRSCLCVAHAALCVIIRVYCSQVDVFFADSCVTIRFCPSQVYVLSFTGDFHRLVCYSQIFGSLFVCVNAKIVVEQIELQAKLLNYFLGSNKSNINQYSILYGFLCYDSCVLSTDWCVTHRSVFYYPFLLFKCLYVIINVCRVQTGVFFTDLCVIIRFYCL